ncbi:GFA family protein [Seohaeicola saemankumensis]|nr:GFA family protein [Seohaeicola saemankumensis]MCA0870545.1 GFA family protein [Seohaeicola saemankumensis]
MTERSGQCMCGAVTFTARDVPATYGACHCEMCRRWTGAALVAATVPAKGITWTGNDKIRKIQSSDWAERAWCDACGTGLYYHVTAPGPMAENYEIPIGLFDDTRGMEMTGEIYIDHKIPSLGFTGDHSRLTRKEVLKQFGLAEDFDTLDDGD